MEDLKFLSNIRNISKQSFKDVNYYIANFILKNLKEIYNFNLDNFAKQTNASKPSVIRFCNKLGLSGFSELKFQIQNLIENNLKINPQFNFKKELVENKDMYKKYFSIKTKSSQMILNDYISKENEVEALLNKLENARTIYIFAMNLAFHTSRNFVERVRWLKKNIVHERDLNSIESYIDEIDENDVVIVLSLSGNSKYLIDFVKKVAKQTYIFGILGKNGNINNYCDLVIEIPQIEYKMWDLYSIRGQCLIQVLDFIYMDLTNYLLEKVQMI